jgi:hypothetical protein
LFRPTLLIPHFYIRLESVRLLTTYGLLQACQEKTLKSEGSACPDIRLRNVIFGYIAGTRGSSVVVAEGYGTDGQGSVTGRDKDFLFTTASRPALGTIQPPILWEQGALSQEVKQPGREANY